MSAPHAVDPARKPSGSNPEIHSKAIRPNLPKDAQQVETPDEVLQRNCEHLNQLSLPETLRNLNNAFYEICQRALRLLGVPLFYSGFALFGYGSMQTLYLLSQGTPEKLVKGTALYNMLIGGMLFTFGNEMMLGRGILAPLSEVLAWLSVGALRV